MPRQILLADDSNTIAKMVQITFAHEDYKITTVKSGEDAVNQARAGRPDVVLLDATMGGRSGYDTCADMRSGGLQMPVLILSNNFVPAEEAQSKAQRAGADGVVIKPFETQALIDRVGQVIAQRASGVRPAAQPSPAPAQPPPASAPARQMAQPPPPQASPARAVSQPPAPAAAAPRNTGSRPATLPPSMMPQPQAPPAAPPPTAQTRGPESSTNLPRPAPRATLMGLPTVGPDGLPIALVPQQMQQRQPPPSAPPPAAPAAPPQAQPRHMTPAAVHGVAARRPSAPMPAVDPTPPRAAPPQRTDHTPPPAPVPSANAAAGRRPAIPPNAPRMPRPSLIPNAPSPDALRQLVGAVANAAAPRIAAQLGDFPEYEAIARLSREVIEQIAWEVVPELAEVILRRELDRLVRERARG